MGVSGYAILAGLLSGAGGAASGIGNSMAEQQKRAEDERLARDKMAAEKEYRDAMVTLERDKVNQGAMPYGVIYKALGLPVPGNVDPAERIPNAVADNVMKTVQEQQKVGREQALNTNTQAFLTRAKGQPAQLMGSLGAEEDPEAAAMIPRSENVPPMSQFDVGAGLAGLGHKDAGIKNLMEVLGFKEPKEPHQPNATAQIMQAAAQAQALKEQGHTPENSPQLRSLIAQLNVAKIVASQAGGDIHGAGNMILGSAAAPPGVAGTPPAPGASVPGGPQPLVRTPGIPSPGERSDIADVDARIAGLSQLAAAARTPEISSMLGVKGMPARLGEDYLKMDNLTSEQRTFRARTAIELMAAKKIMIGVGQSRPELASAAPAIPSDNDPGFAEKLDAWAQWAQQNRDSINSALSGVNIRVPAQQTAPAAPARFGDAFNGNREEFNALKNPNAKMAPKLQPGELWRNGQVVKGTRVRDPQTGQTGTVPPGEPIPGGLEVIQ